MSKLKHLALGALLCLSMGCSALEPMPSATPVPTAAVAMGRTTDIAAIQVVANDSDRTLVSARVRTLPTIDGEMDATWAQAAPLTLPLHRGLDDAARAFDVELRSLHDDETIAFLASWSGEPPTPPADTIRNKLVVHWTIPMPEGGDPFSCMVACHTAFADGHDRFVRLTPETIPTGFSGPLPVGGGRHGDAWIIEWSRPLLSPNPLDIQFSDLTAEYEFMVKVFLDIDGQPDAISDPAHLTLASS